MRKLNKKHLIILVILLFTLFIFESEINNFITTFATRQTSQFNINIGIPKEYKQITNNQELLTVTTAQNLHSIKRIDILLNYQIIKDNEILLEKSETVAIETQLGLIRYFTLKNLEPGNYKIKATLSYQDEKVTSTNQFKITETKESPENNHTITTILLALTITILTLIYIKTKKK